jgi:PPOX class probable F420-dependent enzyme
MTPAQLEAYLTHPWHAIVGTNPSDGPPQLSPVWFVYEDGCIYIGMRAGCAKHRNLQRDPRISVCIDAGHPDARAVIIYGTAELIGDDNPLRNRMRWRIIRKYHETEEAARNYADEVWELPSVIVIVAPQRIISQDFN